MTNPFPGDALWPSNFQGCTVTAQYLTLDGQAVSGTVTFSASPSSILDLDDQLIIVPRTFTATLDTNGSLTIILPATNDPDLNPQGWTYAVSENFTGGRKYNITAPMNATIDLSEVSPVPSSDGAPIWRGPKGEAGGVQMVNGHTGDIITLTYTDVGADQVGAAAAVSVISLHRSNNLSDVNSVSAARTNLGLGSAALQPATAFEPAGAAELYADFLAPIGSIILTAAPIAPNSRWALCQGQALSRTTYSTLFSVVGVTYGVGDGTTTFNVPNLKGRVPVGLDASQAEFDHLNDNGGEKTHVLTGSEMPSHVHAVETGINGVANFSNVRASGMNAGGSGVAIGTFDTGATGSGAAHNNMPPFLTLNYIIRVV